MTAIIAHQRYDVLVVGAGGAGLRAALALSQSGHNCAVVTKVFPTRSHTVSAQGGITAALGHVDEDHWHWHMFDTVKGSDYLGDQDAIEYMCKMGPECVYELERMGLPFSRLENGKIYQRPFGGQSKNFGTGGQATRTSAAADRTGHALLHTLYQQNLKHKTKFLNEWIALDLLKDSSSRVCGISALCMETGEVVVLHARVVVLATGGGGQIYASSTNAYINTGDGLGMALRAGLCLQDMEMWQFHPTGLYGSGCLISEGCRGEGAYLVNSTGERFMERYAPHAKDLASRDVVSRAIATEILEGRGCGPNKDYIELKMEHLGKDAIMHKLPGIRDLAMTFAHADPITSPLPIVPTQHYMMGGIPANTKGQVLTLAENGEDRIIEGLYAIGECACISVHGANRLGGNSLLDLVVFGRAAGQAIIEELATVHKAELLSDEQIQKSYARYQIWNDRKGEYTVPQMRSQVQAVMQKYFGVYRDGDHMQQGLLELIEIKEKMNQTQLQDHSKIFNTARLEAFELDNLLDIALATARSAIDRTESRGAHARKDFPKRDDKQWLRHIVCFQEGKLAYRSINMKPETVPTFEPKDRVY